MVKPQFGYILGSKFNFSGVFVVLEKEISFFESHRSEYCKVYAGQFVLVYGDKFLGSFTTEEQAYAFGIKSIGNVPFLIKRAVPVDEMASVPAYTLGLLSK